MQASQQQQAAGSNMQGPRTPAGLDIFPKGCSAVSGLYPEMVPAAKGS
jgi:hypothetical protein